MDLQTTFYTIGVIYMFLNILILLGIGIILIVLVKMILDLKKKVDEKVKFVQNIFDHPEDYAAQFTMSILKTAFRSVKKAFRAKKSED